MSEEENKYTNAPEIVEASPEEKVIFSTKPEIIYHISEFDGPLDLLVTMLHDDDAPSQAGV